MTPTCPYCGDEKAISFLGEPPGGVGHRRYLYRCDWCRVEWDSDFLPESD